MLKNLNQIKNQRYGFVRVKLLIDYWEKLSEIKKMTLGHYQDWQGKRKKVGILAKGWSHEGTYSQLLYVINHPLGRYQFLMGPTNEALCTYRTFELELEESILLNKSLIEYLVEMARKVSL